MTVTIHVPRLPAGAAANLIGLAGLLAVALALGGLAGWWWALLSAGVFAVALSYVAQTHQAAAETDRKSGAAAPPYAPPTSINQR